MALAASVVSGVLLGCSEWRLPGEPAGVAAVEIGLRVSSWEAGVGEPLAVAIMARSGIEEPVAGLQGWLEFDPVRLEYLGQGIDPAAFTIVNEAAAGEGRLRLASLRLQGLPQRTALLAFRVRAADYARGLRYHLEAASTPSLRHLRSRNGMVIPIPDAEVPVPSAPRHMTLQDWQGLYGGPGSRPALVPGEYRLNLRYGDATLDGAIDIIGDAFYIANVAVGNAPMIAGTASPPRDAVIAANVSPANLPGLGEPDDPQPPGQESNGSQLIDIFDAVAVANEAVGNDVPVVGEVIPGRGPRPASRVQLSGVIPSGTTRLLSRDTVYELVGTVNVEGSARLRIEAGTTLEGDQATRGALVIRRGGHLEAQGTRLQPIVFSCNAATRVPGCWGGIVINGLALLNNGQPGVGGPEVNGCPERPSLGNPGVYGGCLNQDTSGVLRYVRIEYAGMPAPGDGGTPGLALLGVGNGTIADFVQVDHSQGDGLFVSGGRVDLQRIVLTNNGLAGLRWDDGWQGRAQFVIIQQRVGSRYAVDGSNFAPNPDAGPRSAPQIYHLTVVGPSEGSALAGDGVHFGNGSAGAIRDAILLHPGMAGLNIDDAASCARTGDSLEVTNSIFFEGTPEFSDDVDCVDEDAFALDPGRGNRVVSPDLVAPFFQGTADLRPLWSSPATVGFLLPPSDGFFDGSAAYIGAVSPGDPSLNNVPWYAGWATGWP
jgi:hypothetical protein